MSNPITITLRDRTFTSLDPIDTELFALAILLLPGESEADRLENLQRTSVDEATIRRSSAMIVSRLLDPATKAKVAHTLTSLFPDLPPAWVSYRMMQSGEATWHDFKMKLSIEELIGVIGAAISAIKQTPSGQAIEPRPLEQSAIESVEVQPKDLPNLSAVRPLTPDEVEALIPTNDRSIELEAELAAVRAELRKVSGRNGFNPKKRKR